MVQLKGHHPFNVFAEFLGFQYLMVQLKDKAALLKAITENISIPHGTIKRASTRISSRWMYISIPHGTIKSALPQASTVALSYFNTSWYN